jgi:predicted CoA-binding protein
MGEAQQQFFTQAKHVAVYGLKRSGKGFAHDVVRELRRGGKLALSAVHPHAHELAGLAVAPSAAQLRPLPDAALLLLAAAEARVAIDDALAAGIKLLWLAFEAAKQGNADYARGHGATVVEGCPLLFIDGVGSVHGIHRFLAQLFGRL